MGKQYLLWCCPATGQRHETPQQFGTAASSILRSPEAIFKKLENLLAAANLLLAFRDRRTLPRTAERPASTSLSLAGASER
jgi:hypothetical protein